MLDHITGINITDSSNQYTYLVEYVPNQNTINDYEYVTTEDEVYLFEFGKAEQYTRQVNHWVSVSTLDSKNIQNNNIIDNCPLAKIRLYFPLYDVDVNKPHTKLAMTLSIWIGRKNVVLGTFITEPGEALACPEFKKLGNTYSEYVEFNIPDPWEIMYNPSLNAFRQSECLSMNHNNSQASSIYISLYPVTENLLGDGYIMQDGFQGAQNSIAIRPNESAMLHYNIVWEDAIKTCLQYNVKYSDKKDIKGYLSDTYNIQGQDIRFNHEVAVKDKDNLYLLISKDSDDYDVTIEPAEFAQKFKNWCDWGVGLSIQAVLTVIVDGYSKLYLRSNAIPFTKDLYARLLALNSGEITEINLKNIDMNVKNIMAVNKTENIIQTINNPVNSKSNIVQPVFYRTHPVDNIILHPAVTENICINLDGYKSKVKSFIMQVEGVAFMEIGRTQNGVIFKIVGNRLLNRISEGVYYILNEDLELVTTGKYKYEV